METESNNIYPWKRKRVGYNTGKNVGKYSYRSSTISIKSVLLGSRLFNNQRYILPKVSRTLKAMNWNFPGSVFLYSQFTMKRSILILLNIHSSEISKKHGIKIRLIRLTGIIICNNFMEIKAKYLTFLELYSETFSKSFNCVFNFGSLCQCLYSTFRRYEWKTSSAESCRLYAQISEYCKYIVTIQNIIFSTKCQV